MITETNDTVKIDIEEEDLLKACGYFDAYKDYLQKRNEIDGYTETINTMIKRMTTATEVMKAFWCEHFGNEQT